MVGIARILSRPTAKPYRTGKLEHTEDNPPTLNDDGHLTFDVDDIENPMNWSFKRRTYITVCAVFLVVNATFASSGPSGCLPSIVEYFDVSAEVAGLTITVFLLGYCAGPLIFAPLSEFYGRRPIFLISFTAYVAFNFLCAFAPNFAALLIGRFLTGTFVSAPLSNAPGVLADLWGPLDRGIAMAGFAMMVWAGPALGPIISGFLQLTKGSEGWRWSFYVLLMLSAFTAIFLVTIPETYAPVIMQKKAKRIREAKIPGYEDVLAPMETGNRSLRSIYKVALTRPWVILFDPISFLCAVYLSVVYLLLYMLFAIYPLVFQGKRGWNAGVGQLPLLGLIIGAAVGAGIMWLDTQYQTKLIKRGDVLRAEHRLRTALLAGPCLALSMFWFAWSAEYNYVHWIVPTLSGVFIAAAMLCIFVSFLNYIVDTYLMYAASAIAANTVARSACGAAAPLFTDQLFTALGVGGGGSLVAGVAVILAVIPFAFWRYGEGIRSRSKFAPTSPMKKNGAVDHNKLDRAEKGAAGADGKERVPTASSQSSHTHVAASEEARTYRGDRESLDANPFEYSVDENGGHPPPEGTGLEVLYVDEK